MTRRLQIAIVGAGIGGLAVATLLAKAGHSVRVFDQFDAPRPVGSGLVLQPVGLAVLDRIGAGDRVRSCGASIGRMLGIEADKGVRVLDVSYAEGAPGLAIHRASLFDALWSAAMAAEVPVFPSSMISDAPLYKGRRLLENTSHPGPYDLIVDASGARSRLSPLQGRPLPYGAIWSTVPWPAETHLPTSQLTQRYRGASRMAGVLPVGLLPGGTERQAAIFWSMAVEALPHWPDRPLDDWKTEAITLWPEFAPFLATITGHDQMVPARYTHGSLCRPYDEALVFIGDSAHRASPQLGQGANMALLDAMALAWALEREELVDALPLYAQTRRWYVRLYQSLSAAFTPQYQSDSRLLPPLRDHLLAPLSRLWPLPPILTCLVSGKLIPPLAGTNLP